MAESAGRTAASQPRKFRYASQKRSDQRRSKTRVSLGEVYNRWTRIKNAHGIKTHAEMATFLLDRYENIDHAPSTSTPSKGRKWRRRNSPPSSIAVSLSPLRAPGESGEDTLSASEIRCLEDRYEGSNASTPMKRRGKKSRVKAPAPSSIVWSSSETLSDNEFPQDEGVRALENIKDEPLEQREIDRSDDQCMISSSTEEQNSGVASVTSSIPEQKEAATCQSLRSPDEPTATSVSEDQEYEVKTEEDGEFSISVSVGDDSHLLDLESSSEFIVDEECILELFKSCRKCNRECKVSKDVTGLKIVVNQVCQFCERRFQWTNLPDDDDDDEGEFQINGQDTATSTCNG